MTKVIERKTYLRPEEEAQSKNVPEKFYQSHTSYDPNDKRDMAALTPKGFTPTSEIVSDAEQKANNTIVTPRGRRISADNFSLRSIVPEVFDNMEKRENERAALAEKRMKGRQAGMLISDALKTLVDVYGQKKGAHNTRRAPENLTPTFDALDRLDAEHAAALQKLSGARYAAMEGAINDANNQALRSADAQQRQASKEEELDWQKERFYEDQAAKDKRAKDSIEAANKRAEDANKTRRALATRPHTANKGAGNTSKSYRYSTSDADRSNPNYKNIGADNEGTVSINSEHVARYKDQFIDRYNKLQAQKAEAVKNNGDIVGISQKIAAMEASDAYKAAFDMSNGGVLTDAQASAILRSEFTPESYQHMRNQPYTQKPEVEKVIPGVQILHNIMSNPDLIKTRQQGQAKPTAQTQVPTQTQEKPVAEQPYRYHNASLNAKPGSPEHSKAVVKVAEGDYRGLSPEEMQDKAMYRISNRVNQYNSKYGKDNQSPMAQDHREKMSIEIFNELKDYWANQPEFMAQLEKLAKKRSTKGEHITVDDLIMDVADDVANGKKPINKIL